MGPRRIWNWVRGWAMRRGFLAAQTHRRARRLRVESFEERAMLAIVPELVRNINPNDGLTDSSNPSNFVEVGSTVFFTATDTTHGIELWKSDGTSAGTVLVRDLRPGGNSANPRYLTNVNGTLYFRASDGSSGEELWKSDGTSAGTVLVRDIRSGTGGADPRYLTNVNGTLYLTANNVTNGRELWKSDGTSAGTVLVRDINLGVNSASPTFLTNLNGMLYFQASDGNSGAELWKSDGTSVGTVLVRDINPGVSAANPVSLTNANGTLYFQSNDGISGAELWKSDGTSAGTVLVRDINPGVSAANPASLTNVNGTLYFQSNDGSNGTELWKSDGTSAGTVLVQDINPGVNGANPTSLTNVNGSLYFQATDGSSGVELWISDGTSAGTVLVRDINPGVNSASPIFLTNVNGNLYFQANNGTNGLELWKSDGTSTGTVRVRAIRSPRYLTNVNGTLYFGANGSSKGYEMWNSDGTSAGTVLVRDINPSAYPSRPRLLTNVNGTLYFQARDGSRGIELWKSDGTSAGTVQVEDIFPLAQSATPTLLTNVNGTLYFQARDGISGYELWKTDGTSTGTVLVREIRPGNNSAFLRSLTNVNGTLYFSANDGASGYELWKSDGTSAGTVLVRDITPGLGSANPAFFTNVNGILFFLANDDANGRELWKSDGTSAGTRVVRDIFPGSVGSSPTYLTNVNGTLYFRANDGSSGVELWKSDGTSAGTVLVRDIRPVGISAYLRYLMNVNGTLYFQADDGTNGAELWKSDGTSTGTVLVKDINSGDSSSPRYFTDVNGTLYFRAFDGNSGDELWKSDGTSAGTTLVRDIVSGSSGSYPESLVNYLGRLVFVAADESAGFEIWMTDGTSSGTTRIADINPGPESSAAQGFTVVNNRLFFSAYIESIGLELWAAGENTVTLGDFVWSDNDGDGIQDVNEPGLAGVEVELFESLDNIVGNNDDISRGVQITNATGHYAFANVTPGVSQYLVVRPATGLMLTQQDQGGSDALDSDVDELGRTAMFVPAFDTNVLSFDMGLVPNDVYLSMEPNSLDENGGTATVTATLTKPSTQAVTINLAFSGAATSGVDYSASATTITIPAGSTAGSITLTGLNDFTFEDNESLVVDISNVTGGSENNTQQVTATITDDESAPLVNLALAPNTLAENGGTATVTATLTNPSTQAVTINLAFSGAATSGVDYSASATTITIPAGSTAGSITLTGLNDLTYESDESLVVDISGVTGGSENGTQQVTATISDDDSAPTVQFQLASSSANEAAGNVTIVVTLSAPSAMATSVPFTLGGTATNADRTVSASPLVIAAGQTSAAIVVSVVNDSLDELNESVVLQLGTPTNATLGANSQHTLTIVDNDAPPVVQFTTLSQSVNESTPTAQAIIRLTQPSGLDVTVPITVSGSATSADASVSTTLPVTIPAGQTSVGIDIAIADDSAAEATETLVLTIGTPTNATRGAVSSHTLSILDNDSTVAVQLAGGNFNVGEASGSVPLSVTLSTFALQPIIVPLILSGSADGQDYRLSTTSVTIPAGQTRAIVTLTVIDDQRDELPETLTIQLGTPVGGELGTNTALTVTIDDNDPVLSFVRSSDTTSDESGTITVIARALSPVIADLTVPFTSFGSATLGVDYTLSANAFQFLAGASTAAITLTIVDDAVVESSEAVTLSLQPPPNTSLGSPGLFTLFISDNDTPAAVGLDLNGLAAGQDFLSPVGEFVEDAAALVIVPNATVVPPGVQTLTSLTVYLESAPNGAAESLTAVNSGGASATAYNPSTRSLTISGGTTSEQQAVLRSVAYQNSSQNPTAGGRFITVTANFSASTESRRRKLNVTPVDDAPVVTITAGTPTYITGNAPLIVDAGIALSDIENNRLVRAEVTITDGESGDVLSLSSPVAGFTSTFAGNVLTITANAGSGNLAAFRSALSRVQFSTTTIGDGNRSVSFIVTDTSGLTGIAGATSAPAVRALSVQSPLLVAASPLNSAAANESLTPSQLAPLVHEALARWESAGATAAQLNVLRAATIEIRDLSDPRTLALAGGKTIVLDINAAGRGWFIDSTPSLDEEFSVPLTTSAARAATGPAIDRVDLLTTILHEYGHLLGLDDHLGSTDLLAESLPLGTRRNLTAAELSQYFAQLGD